jgi:hypothetical protein
VAGKGASALIQPAREPGAAKVVQIPVLPLLAAAATAACPSTAAEIGVDARLSGADVLVVWKSARRIGHYEHGLLVACRAIALAPDAPDGPKRREGDRRTPEGWYRTSDKPASRFPLAIAVHSPNAADAELGRANGAIDAATAERIAETIGRDEKPPQTTALGGEILIHGGGASADWTLGCIALETAELAALRARLPADLRLDVLLLP